MSAEETTGRGGSADAQTSPCSDGPAATPAAARRRHIYEIDIVRILTFASVIAVHTTSHTIASNDVPLYVFLGLAHFTREPFFWITGFVLMWSYFHKPVPMRRFWPRRFLLIGVPYLVWSMVYVIIDECRSPKPGGAGGFAWMYVHDVLTGTAWYHLYFLLVTMQVYLLVPAIAWLVRRTRRHHTLLLAAAAAVQLTLMGFYYYAPHLLGGFVDYDKQYFFSYTFFILAGAVCADHADAFFGWVATHRPLIGLLTLGSAAVTVGVFFLQHALGYSLYGMGNPVQPIIVLWGVGVGLGFTALGSWWSEKRTEGSLLSRTISTATDRSFGIFLSHPVFIWLWLWVGDGWLAKAVPKPWLTPVAYLLVVLSAIAVTELARRSPVSLWFTGRPRRRAAARA